MYSMLSFLVKHELMIPKLECVYYVSMTLDESNIELMVGTAFVLQK